MNGEKKMMYVAPSTIRNSVELEGTFCASADVENPDTDSGRIVEHAINDAFEGDFTGTEWDIDPNKAQ